MKTLNKVATLHFILAIAALIWFFIATDNLSSLETMTLIYFAASTLGLIISYADFRRSKKRDLKH